MPVGQNPRTLGQRPMLKMLMIEEILDDRVGQPIGTLISRPKAAGDALAKERVLAPKALRGLPVAKGYRHMIKVEKLSRMCDNSLT